MVVTKTFNVDLVRLEVPPTWACMQGDANSRAICYQLYADGLRYEIPSGVSLRIAYEKQTKQVVFIRSCQMAVRLMKLVAIPLRSG